MSLKELAQRVQAIQKILADLEREKESTCDSVRYAELPREINLAKNDLYAAVNELNDFILAETGISGYQFPDLLRSRGYVLGLPNTPAMD